MKFDYKGFYILHGEDDSTDIQFMKRMLDTIDYNGEYKNLTLGQDVIAWSEDTHNALPGLIFLDIGMPGVDGKEILRKLRENERTSAVPIVIMSGSSSLRDYSECIQLGANGYIKKTSERDMFSSVCRNFIQGWAQLTKQTFF